MTEITEEEKLALEQAAKQEGREDAKQDAAIEDAAEEARKAAEEAERAKQSAEFTESRLSTLERRLDDFAGSVTAQLEAMGQAIEILAEAEVVEDTTNQEIKQEIKEGETEPLPAKEPERRKRGWA